MGRHYGKIRTRKFSNFLVEFGAFPIVLFPVCAVLYLSVCFPWLTKYTSIKKKKKKRNREYI